MRSLRLARQELAVTWPCGNSLRHRQRRTITAAKAGNRKDDNSTTTVTYGRDWYSQTRQAMDSRTSAREQLERYRRANREANNGREREDLYTDNWDGDVYKGGKVNILSVLIAVSILAPLAGLLFALQTYGTLWG